MHQALSPSPQATAPALVAALCRPGRTEVSAHFNSRVLKWRPTDSRQGYSVRESAPQTLPDRPPFTAHLGNLSYDATVESVTDFFAGSEIVSVRIIEDREMQRPKGFGYVEFTDLDGLKKALQLDGESFQGRMIKIKIADPRKYLHTLGPVVLLLLTHNCSPWW